MRPPLGIAADGILEGIDAVFRKVEAHFAEKEGAQLVGVDPCIDDGVVLVIPHGRRHIYAAPEKEIDGKRLAHGPDGEPLFSKRALG